MFLTPPNPLPLKNHSPFMYRISNTVCLKLFRISLDTVKNKHKVLNLSLFYAWYQCCVILINNCPQCSVFQTPMLCHTNQYLPSVFSISGTNVVSCPQCSVFQAQMLCHALSVQYFRHQCFVMLINICPQCSVFQAPMLCHANQYFPSVFNFVLSCTYGKIFL